MKKETSVMMLLITLIGLGCSDDMNKEIQGTPNFFMQDDLACTILISTDKAKIGEKVTLIGLTSSNPKVLFEHEAHAGTSPMKNIFEDEDTLVIQLVAYSSGATDTISLNKKTGVFLRAGTSSLVDSVFAEKGNCK